MTQTTGATYPPPPWRLAGELLVSAFRVPVGELPPEAAACLPGGRRPVAPGGQAIVGVAFAHYTPSGVLAYDELLVAVATAGRPYPLAATVAQIWVDSPRSLAGGRALWGIPKELGRFRGGPASRELEGVAELRGRAGRRLLPGLVPVPLPTAQRFEGREICSSNLVLARPRALRAAWRFEPDGPLGWLHGRAPVLSVALTDATIVFGLRDRQSAATAP